MLTLEKRKRVETLVKQQRDAYHKTIAVALVNENIDEAIEATLRLWACEIIINSNSVMKSEDVI